MDAHRRLSRSFAGSHPQDAARLLEAIGASHASRFFQSIDPEIGARVLASMSPASAAACFALLSLPQAAAILPLVPPYSGASLVRHLDQRDRERCLSTIPEESAHRLSALLKHGERTAGALMESGALSVQGDITIRAAREQLRRLARIVRYYLYVVDRSMRLTGVLTLRELLTAPADAPVHSVMSMAVAYLNAGADREAILAHPGWRSFHALPVVDDGNRLLGVVRYDSPPRARVARRPQLRASGPCGHGGVRTVLARAHRNGGDPALGRLAVPTPGTDEEGR